MVTGFNALQFAADFVAALAEARRVTRSGGRVAICNWGRVEDCEVHAISERKPSSPRAAPIVGEPGVLEQLARRAGLNPERAEALAVPHEFPDRSSLERALLAIAPSTRSRPRLPSAWSAKRSRRRLSAVADPIARTGSTTAGGI